MGPSTPSTPSSSILRDRLDEASIADAHRLGRRLRNLKRKKGEARDRALEAIAGELERSIAAVAARRPSTVVPTYPADLPITTRRDHLPGVLTAPPVVTAPAETGPAKTHTPPTP